MVQFATHDRPLCLALAFHLFFETYLSALLLIMFPSKYIIKNKLKNKDGVKCLVTCNERESKGNSLLL